MTHIQYFRITPGDTIAVPEKCSRLIKILTATIYRWVQCIVRIVRDLNIVHMTIWSQVFVLLTLPTIRTELWSGPNWLPLDSQHKLIGIPSFFQWFPEPFDVWISAVFVCFNTFGILNKPHYTLFFRFRLMAYQIVFFELLFHLILAQ